MTLSFRFAEERDVPAVVDLVESAYRGDSSREGWTTEADLLDGRRTDDDSVLGHVRGERGDILLAESDGRLVGCCYLERRPEAQVYFGMFAVQPGLQGQGTGGKILREAERLASADWGGTTMVMTVIAQRRDLIAWYERRGYRSTGEGWPFPDNNERFGRPRRPDLSFVVLAKPLTGDTVDGVSPPCAPSGGGSPAGAPPGGALSDDALPGSAH